MSFTLYESAPSVSAPAPHLFGCREVLVSLSIEATDAKTEAMFSCVAGCPEARGSATLIPGVVVWLVPTGSPVPPEEPLLSDRASWED
jgi:hypothetical protein